MKGIKIVPLAVLLTVSAFMMSASCSSSQKTNDNETEANTSNATDTLNSKVAAFKKEWNKKLDKLDKQIDKDQKKVSDASSAKKDELNRKINSLKMKRDQLKQEIDAAGNKTAAQWDDFKNDVSTKYQELKGNVKDLFNND
jgi:outer membrane murein-binding lipoprotein Lpp